MKMTLSNQLPEYPVFAEGIRRAPDRGYTLSPAQTVTALKNALRYIPVELHRKLAPEFLEELRTRGRIYGYRFRPAGDLKAKPVDEYQGNCIEGKAFQVMIDNNLCFDIALYPYELVTYGETGQVCQNWMQYRLIKQYLELLTREQTLVIESGHPLGLFHSRPDAPRVIITNSMMVGMFDNQHDWHEAAQMGVANYGQMTAGGWMYIGPQGIVHGTFNTLLNAGRLKLGIPQDKNLSGHLFVSSGLGGMSGAQPKAAEIAGAASIIAEVDRSRIETRYKQGWVEHVTTDLHTAFRMALSAAERHESCSVAYHGNVVDLLEYAVQEDIPIELLSDQTSCHAVYEGGYCPAGVTFEERTRLLHESPEAFRQLVDESIKDGSNVMADMAVQCFAGNCARGMSLVALHNGGGVGIGKAINGGFGMVCDGSLRVDEILRSSMLWDVMGGVARRSWARNEHAMETSEAFNLSHGDAYHITLPYLADEELIKRIVAE